MDAAVLDIDPFAPAVLDDPYPAHARMRAAGPVVRLAPYGIWAAARWEPVQSILTDWQTFCSSAGVGLADFRKEPPWRPPSLILEADPPLHTRTRGVLARVLSPAALKALKSGFETAAAALVDRVLAAGQVDAITDLAEAFPLTVFPDAVGLAKAGREHLLPYGDMAFNAFGPKNALFEAAFANAEPVVGWITAQCRRAALAPEGFGAQIYAAADAGDLTEAEAGLLVRSLLSAGLDTTIYSLGAALTCLARFPDQWQRLRTDPGLARAAFEEAIRFESPVQTFFRTTTRTVEIGGVAMGAGEKVLMVLAAANRDPLKWEDPDRYDIGRRTLGHVGFGAGIHGCVGQMLARLEGEVLLTELARRVETIEIAGPPVRRYNNTLRGLASLPITLRPAQH